MSMILYSVAYCFSAGMALMAILMFPRSYRFRMKNVAAGGFLALLLIASLFPTIALALISSEIEARGKEIIVIHKMITFKDCELVDMKNMECIN